MPNIVNIGAAANDGTGDDFRTAFGKINDNSRIKLTANTTVYVATTGNDTTGDGSSGNPWLTVQKAIHYIEDDLDLNGWRVTISLAAGTYNGNIDVQGFVGPGDVRIEGDTGTPSNVVLNHTSDVLSVGSAKYGTLPKVIVAGVKFTSTSGAAIICYDGTVDIYEVEFGAAPFHAYSYGKRGLIRFLAPYSITGGGAFHLCALEGGVIELISVGTITLVGTPAFSQAAWLARNHGTILFRGVGPTIVGTATGTRWQVQMNGVICGTTYQFGSIAGVTLTGGQTQAAVT